MSLRCGALAISMFAAAGAAAAQEEAWTAGRIFLPASLSVTGSTCSGRIGGKCMDRIVEGRHPVILFLPGCYGAKRPRAFFDFGAIVVEPNTFWQGERCTLNIAEMTRLASERLKDVTVAAKELAAADWADPARLVLAGFSQGAMAAAFYQGPEFKARIFVAWPCQVRGPALPEAAVRGDGPVLAIQSRNEEMLKRLNVEGDCGPDVSARAGSRSVFVPGNPSELMDSPATREAIAAFVPEALR
jgi:hypothetical protein